jgi:hypothetical protein
MFYRSCSSDIHNAFNCEAERQNNICKMVFIIIPMYITLNIEEKTLNLKDSPGVYTCRYKQDELLDCMMTILHKCYALNEISTDSEEFRQASEGLDRITSRILQEALEQDDTTIQKRLVVQLHEAILEHIFSISSTMIDALSSIDVFLNNEAIARLVSGLF